MSFPASTQSSNTDGPSLVPKYHVLSSSDVYQIVPSDDSNGSFSYLLNSSVENPWSDDTSFQETDKADENCTFSVIEELITVMDQSDM